MPYAVGRDKEAKAPSFWESGIKRGLGENEGMVPKAKPKPKP